MAEEERLSFKLSIRVTKSEYIRVTEKAAALGYRPSWYLRQILLEGSDSVTARPPKAHLQTASRISSIASGLSCLVRLAEQRAPLPVEIVGILDSVHAAARATMLELRAGRS